MNLAIKNVAKFGDTDVFPSPLDRYVCQDQPGKVLELLKNIDSSFDHFLENQPPSNIDCLAQIGYTSFRWTTQLDPFWNLYFLSQVIQIAEKIEHKRIPTSENTTYSYRWNPNVVTGHLFGPQNWRAYKDQCLELSNNHSYVLVADVADFYARAAHHRLDNELDRLEENATTVKRLKILISKFSETRSYGLPVGGPASRILAELCMVPIDLYLDRKGIKFCRYVDDFHIFSESEDEAHRHLAFLSQVLFNEGLSLQRSKTRILETKELRATSSHLSEHAEDPGVNQSDQKQLMRLSLRYDPYSLTAEQDYEALKEVVASIDVVGILMREISKTNIDSQITKQAILAIQALEPESRDEAVCSLMTPANLSILCPVFVNVMKLIRSIYEDLSSQAQNHVQSCLVSIVQDRHHILENDLNLTYFLKAFRYHKSREKEMIVIELFEHRRSPLVRKEIILILADWKSTYWLSNQRTSFSSMNKWERKAFIIASFTTGDEGHHWFKHTKRTFSKSEKLVAEWFDARRTTNPSIPV